MASHRTHCVDVANPVDLGERTNDQGQGGASNGHYGGNAETYMNVGEAMGRAMVELNED